MSSVSQPIGSITFAPQSGTISYYPGDVPQGALWNPDDLGTLFTTAAGTVSVAAIGDPCGLMIDTRLPSSSKRAVFSGVSGTFLSTPDSVANSITGDIDIRVRLVAADWSHSADQHLVNKDEGAPNRSYYLRLETSGALRFMYGQDGTTAASDISTASVPFADGATGWVRATADINNGAGGADITFYYSTDTANDSSLVSWVQLGNVVTKGAPIAIPDTGALVKIGADSAGAAVLIGSIHRAQIYNGINGTLAVDFNPADYTSGTTMTSSTTGEVYTINGNARIVKDGNHAVQTTAGSRPLLGIQPKIGVRNLLTRTEEFNNAAWTKNNTTISANVGTSPDGTVTADRIIETAVNSTHTVHQPIACVSGLVYTFSIYARAAERSRLNLNLQLTASVYNVQFDLSAVTTSTVSGSGSATITAVGDGWYRCTATATATGSGTGAYQVEVCDDAGARIYLGDITKGLRVTFSQAELGSTATTYQRVVQWYDVVQDSRTRRNQITYSDEFNNAIWTKTNTAITADTDGIADLFYGVGGSALKILSHSTGVALFGSALITWQAKLKESTHRYAQVSINGDATKYVNLDTRNGDTSANGTGVTATSTLQSDGYYLFTVSCTGHASTTRFYLSLQDSLAAAREASSATTNGILVKDWQSELSASATTYQRVVTWYSIPEVKAQNPHVLFLAPDGSDDFMTMPGTASTWKFLHDGTGGYMSLGVQFGIVPNPLAVYRLMDSRTAASGIGFGIGYNDSSANDRLFSRVQNAAGAEVTYLDSAEGACPSNTRMVVSSYFDNNASPKSSLSLNQVVLDTDTSLANAASGNDSGQNMQLFRDSGGNYLIGKFFGGVVRQGVPSPLLQNIIAQRLAQTMGITL